MMPGTGHADTPVSAPRPRVGISACLLGDEVRYDGGHKRDAFLADVLGPHVEWVRVCPEVEVGMGTPREALRLVEAPDGSVRMETVRTRVDYTDTMRSWARARLDALEEEDLSGYVLKKNSPSCGMHDVKVFDQAGAPRGGGQGLFAGELIARFPNLPVEEEGRLADPAVREHFVERIFAYRRLRDFFAQDWTAGGLVTFHAAHKMTLLSHSAVGYNALGRLVALVTQLPRASMREQYERGFMTTLASAATPQRHTDVLMHMAGHLKKLLDATAKAQLLDAIDSYRRGRVPLSAPLELIRGYARAYQVAYLAAQTYLAPAAPGLARWTP